jgi:hypothetical protein
LKLLLESGKLFVERSVIIISRDSKPVWFLRWIREVKQGDVVPEIAAAFLKEVKTEIDIRKKEDKKKKMYTHLFKCSNARWQSVRGEQRIHG